MGKQVIEPRILDEVDMYCKHFIEPHLGEPISLSTLNMATCNVISVLVFGGRSDYDDPKFKVLMEAMDTGVKANLRAGITSNIPLARFFKFSGHKVSEESDAVLLPEMEGQFQQTKDSPDLDNPRNMFDYFILHQQEKKDFGNAFTGATLAPIIFLKIHFSPDS